MWWKRFVDRRHRAHTPGVWVVYFSLAALPLFGIGQWFIPSTDLASRQFAFQLLCIYVASALGLLLTTSFLGLRRYLRQRRLQMPMDMASLWLGIGAIMIVLLLVVCILFPRPGAVTSISQLPFQFGSPDQSRTSKWAFGNDGPEQPQASRTRPDAKKTSQDSAGAGKKTQTGSSSGKSSAGKSGSRAKQRGGQNGGRKSSQESSRQQDQGGSKKSNSAGSRQQSDQSGGQSRNQDQKRPAGDNHQESSRSSQAQGQSKSGKSGSRDQGPRKQDRQQGSSAAKDRSDQSKSGKSAGKNAGRQGKGGQRSNDSKSPQDQSGNKSGQESRSGESRSKEESKSANRRTGGPRFENDGQPKSRPEARQANKSSSSAGQSQPSRSFSPTRALEKVASVFGMLLKLLFFVALLCVVGFLVWKYREQVRKAIEQLIEDLRQLWARLFGGRPTDQEPEMPADNEAGQRGRSFASFRDPFTSGVAKGYTTEQLVCYSFDALEAWARERHCGRQEEQTPIEFGRQVARRFPDVAGEAQILADLYSRVVYGRLKISLRRQDDLQRLWRQLRAVEPASAIQ